MSASHPKYIPSHPTLVYITRLLHFAGYGSVIGYLVALFLIKPLLQNKANLLQNFYNFNLKSLSSIYTSLVKKYTIVPDVLVTYSGKQYTDATTDTGDLNNDRDILKYQYNLSVQSKNKNYDPNFAKSTFVTTCLKSIEKVEDLQDKLQLFNDRLTKSNQNNYIGDLSYSLHEFNDDLISDRVDRDAFDRNGLATEISTKIRKMKGKILTM